MGIWHLQYLRNLLSGGQLDKCLRRTTLSIWKTTINPTLISTHRIYRPLRRDDFRFKVATMLVNVDTIHPVVRHKSIVEGASIRRGCSGDILKGNGDIAGRCVVQVAETLAQKFIFILSLYHPVKLLLRKVCCNMVHDF